MVIRISSVASTCSPSYLGDKSKKIHECLKIWISRQRLSGVHKALGAGGGRGGGVKAGVLLT